jgi:CheY-like chemotaxis protein
MEKAAKIIVVDDEQRICQNVAKILSNQNYEVVQAASAEEALKKLAGDSFSLLISDIVMPGMNGLELLKLVKNQWPLTKAVMITGYASTDTAAKAIRLGALDYLPKPFTPDELRKIVDLALEEKLVEASIPETERQAIDTKTTKPLPPRSTIDVDIPFDRAAVEESVGESYANALGRSDLPVFEQPATETLQSYCRVGNIFCDVFKKLDATCKVGRKSGECPKKKAQDRKGGGKDKAFDARELIGIDVPFNYEEVVSVTGPEYVTYLNRDGMSFVPFD